MTTHQAQAVMNPGLWSRLFPRGQSARQAAPKTPLRYPSVQQGFLTLRAVQDDLLCFAPSPSAEDTDPREAARHDPRKKSRRRAALSQQLLYRAVIEVGSLNFGLKGAGEQEVILAGYAAFLNSLGYPVQLLTRVVPFDVTPYVAPYVARAGAAEAAAYQSLIEDHLRYVRELTLSRALLERRFYLVIPAENALAGLTGGSRHDAGGNLALSEPAASGMSVMPAGLRRLMPGTRRARERQRDTAVVVQRLALRANDVIRQLTRFGVAGRRLRTPELIALYADCLTPGASGSITPAGHGEVRRDVAEFTPLAIHGIAGHALAPLPGDMGQARHGGAAGIGVCADADSGLLLDDGVEDGRILRGTDTLLDRLAPAAIEIKRDALHVDDQWVQTLAVTGYPRSVFPGWLAHLIDLDEPFDLSLHMHPLSSTAMIRQLTSRMVALHSSRLLDQRHGRLPDPEREVAYGDMERMRDALQRGDERVFSLALYLLVRAPTRKALAERRARIQRHSTTCNSNAAQQRWNTTWASPPVCPRHVTGWGATAPSIPAGWRPPSRSPPAPSRCARVSSTASRPTPAHWSSCSRSRRS